MHRYRPYSSASKATPTTRCQKCLKLGHYSYECKSVAQERPYISRPSRTQQLFNPKLQTKLTEAAPPNEVSLTTKKGVADSILKQKEEEREREGRSRKRRRDGSASPPPGTRPRDRSSSVSSYSSYSSISSGRSPSPPARSRAGNNGREDRRRSDSYSRSPDHERSVRRKFRDSPSPGMRGRRLSPTDSVRRTRSASRPRRVKATPTKKDGSANGGATRRDPSPRPLPPAPVQQAPRGRSPSPFTRRRLMTEAMQRGV
ncbi:zinc knuckle-domain-containing protein [Tricharina praecox]|uniref:zinc knuckle-domain-containing protein n=1 Tax=Tricharina praecox TaxID=43433 RepID=UPI002220862D|nr:zinc knuckle-domain-containing protein [Tricharina praecox]KAI5857146.1 zinc knuckle-domain-containing protein [Tricharina praecox]